VAVDVHRHGDLYAASPASALAAHVRRADL
jgi:hypothetical protein